jgi:hypothetical protein
MRLPVSVCWIWRRAVRNLRRHAAGKAVVKMAPPAARMVAVLVMTLVVLKLVAVVLLDTSAVKGHVSGMAILKIINETELRITRLSRRHEMRG